jgi:lysophospholipase L1-like esterase
MTLTKLKKAALVSAIVVLPLALIISSALISVRLYVNQFIKDNYQRRVEIWQETAASIPPNSIVFVGDSHTEYFFLEEYFPGVPVFNRGIFGDTTYGLTERLDESVLKLYPAKAFLLIGVNDIVKTNDTNETIASNIIKIVRRIKTINPGTTIYVQSLYPARPNISYNLPNERIRAINVLLESYCNDEEIIYIDVHSKLIDTAGQLREEFTVDKVHLNAVGYRYVAEILRPYI